jgi:hypothetical protein
LPPPFSFELPFGFSVFGGFCGVGCVGVVVVPPPVVGFVGSGFVGCVGFVGVCVGLTVGFVVVGVVGCVGLEGVCVGFTVGLFVVGCVGFVGVGVG